MKRDTLKKFAKTLSESAPIHYDRGMYSPDTTATAPGDLVLSIIARANNRVKGTVTGTIYRSNVGQNLIPSKLSCTFDLLRIAGP
jgi:hypothetical protein